MIIKRQDLIQQLVDKHNYTKKAAKSVIDDFTGIISDNYERGNSVSIHNFGCFDLLWREARRGKNPNNGEPVDIPGHYIPRFYPGNGMRVLVKKWEDSAKRGMI